MSRTMSDCKHTDCRFNCDFYDWDVGTCGGECATLHDTEQNMSDDLIRRQDAIDVLEERIKANGYSNVGLVSELNRIIGYLMQLPSAQHEQKRVFVELVAEYPDPELCTYPEYKGKPYYSIKYMENGEKFIGYGTYNPEVLSRYLKEYFMQSAQPERKEGEWIKRDDGTMCSNCGFALEDWIQSIFYNYCPNCGSDMRKEQNDDRI